MNLSIVISSIAIIVAIGSVWVYRGTHRCQRHRRQTRTEDQQSDDGLHGSSQRTEARTSDR